MPKAPITIGTIVTFMFHGFFNSLARSRYLFFFSHSFWLILWSTRTAKSTILQILFFLLLIIIITYSLEFFTSALADGLLLELSESKSPQVSRTRLRILAVISKAVVWIVSTRPPTSKSSRPFNNPLVIVPKAPITIGTIVTFMFHGFFNSLAMSRYLSFFSHSFTFILWSAGTARWTILQIPFFFCWLLLGLVLWPGLDDPFVC